MRHKGVKCGRQGEKKEASTTGHTAPADRFVWFLDSEHQTLPQLPGPREAAVVWPLRDRGCRGSPLTSLWPFQQCCKHLITCTKCLSAWNARSVKIPVNCTETPSKRKMSVRPLCLSEIPGMMFRLDINVTLNLMPFSEHIESSRAPRKIPGKERRCMENNF